MLVKSILDVFWRERPEITELLTFAVNASEKLSSLEALTFRLMLNLPLYSGSELDPFSSSSKMSMTLLLLKFRSFF